MNVITKDLFKKKTEKKKTATTLLNRQCKMQNTYLKKKNKKLTTGEKW